MQSNPFENLGPFMYTNKYAPKLTFAERCELYTFHHYYHVSVTILAEAYGITVPVATNLCNRAQKKYANVKREEYNIGIGNMNHRYVTEAGIRRVQEVIKKRNPQAQPMNEYPEDDRFSVGEHRFQLQQLEGKFAYLYLNWDVQATGLHDTEKEARNEAIKWAGEMGATPNEVVLARKD